MMTPDQAIELMKKRVQENSEWGIFLTSLECAALLARIEQGDRALEALEMVEWVTFAEHYEGDWLECPWCHRGDWNGHAPDCPRQIALGKER